MHRMRWATVLTLILISVLTWFSEPLTAAPGDSQTEPKAFDAEARVMFWADASDRVAVPGQPARLTDLFVRRARAVVKGRVSDAISFSIQIGQDNVGARAASRDRYIRIKDAYLNYRLANAAQIAIGQFKIPFLRANLESAFGQILVDRGSLTGLRPAREGSRDLGAMAWGNVQGLQYRLAVFDGSDQTTDNPGSGLRLSSRVAYNWFMRETGFSYTGSYLGTARVLQVAAQVDVQGSRTDARDAEAFRSELRDYRAYAVEAFFEQPLDAWAVTVDGAWVDRTDDYSEPDLLMRTIRGYYVQPALLLPDRLGPGRLQLAVRREDWNTDRGALEGETARTTFGATYYLQGHDRKLQADYTTKRESPEVDNNEFRLCVVLVF